MSVLLLLLSGTLSASQTPRKDLALFYRRACAECHGQDGGARSPFGLRLAGRNLADHRWQAKTPDADMVKAILKGKREMPAFGASLSEEDAKRLVTEILRPMAARKN
ncbi:MAG TPA: cytochrome c [Holophagaceae bacterium]|nr:cytochrome c [Holophagaceae bacterium]